VDAFMGSQGWVWASAVLFLVVGLGVCVSKLIRKAVFVALLVVVLVALLTYSGRLNVLVHQVVALGDKLIQIAS
jgi:hypothetical protein